MNVKGNDMFRRNKILLLLICLLIIVFLYACESVPIEDYYTNYTDAYDAYDAYINDIDVYEDIETDIPVDPVDVEEYIEEEIPEQEEFYPDDRTTLQVLLDTANEHRVSIEKVDDDTVIELAYSREFLFYDRAPLFSDRVGMRVINSIEEAIEDVEVLFKILRYIYGAYQYFGGDDVFNHVKEQIIDDINNDNSISSLTLLSAINSHLYPVIMDNHFFIENTRYGPEYVFLASSDVFFDRTNRGFNNRENGLYIEEIKGHNLESLMRLQLDNYGMHFYGPLYQREGASSTSHTITILYENGTSEYIELLRIPTGSRNVFRAPASLTYIDDIPIVSLSWMMGLSAIPHGVHAHNFLSYAEELRDEPVVILDIRSNTGGMSILPSMWMYLLTGEVVNGNFIQLVNWDIEYDYPWNPWGDTPETNPFYFSEEDWEYLEPVLLDPTYINGYIVHNFIDRNVIEREQILIVLIDRHTSSAGEFFTDMVFNVENVIVIGQNTEGNLISDAQYPNLRLPNSGINIRLGLSVMLWPEGHFSEGAGIAPNVWVTGCALTATLAMLANEHVDE